MPNRANNLDCMKRLHLFVLAIMLIAFAVSAAGTIDILFLGNEMKIPEGAHWLVFGECIVSLLLTILLIVKYPENA